MASFDWQMSFVARSGDRLTLRAAEPTSIASSLALIQFITSSMHKAMLVNRDFISNGKRETSNWVSSAYMCQFARSPCPLSVSSLCLGFFDCSCHQWSCRFVSHSPGPPAIVFPRKNYKDIFMQGDPEGGLGLANLSGWTNIELFLEVLKHFVKHARPTADHQVVLVMDNHESHVSLAARVYAKQNNVHIVTLTPHTSHKTQPLDICIRAFLETYFNLACHSWCLANPGRPISIYDMAALFRDA
ncbi:tigger transposable element-derived protein [Elysia marginata]|uniref:Tigger transposable element-derived protein n=1 Tax=Elysia marginata TaxID=1093978 RepID=A0AAV4EJG4_9GAST|nr:tigger transposable element-derived protein [Elysia marginata]